MDQTFGSSLITIALICFCLLSSPTHASHNMGADLSYTCIGANTYVFTLAFYRDCAGISAPSAPSLNIHSPSGCGSTQSVSMTQQSVAEASSLCPAQLPNSTCNGGNLQGVEVYTYTATVTLSGACPDWIAYFSDCCRNSVITNSNTGPLYVEATINNSAVACNNSPTFSTPPVPYICYNQPFNYNHGSIDIDGDSLVFSLINPKESATIDVSHNPGFSATQPLSTVGAFNFDAHTGQMDFTPDALQIAVVAVLVEEYRHGVLIGSVMRDMQVVVISCQNNIPVPNPVSNLTGAVLNGNAFETCVGNTLSFDINCPDADPTDLVSINHNITNALPGATVQVTNGNPATISVSWFVSSINNQSFSINFNDGACPIIGQQIIGYAIKPTTVSFPAQDSIKCPNETTMQLQALTAANGGTYSWSPANNLSDPTLSNPVATIVNSPATFAVTYTDVIGCTATNALTIKDHTMSLDLTPNTSYINHCQGDPAIALSASLNGDVPVSSPSSYDVSTKAFAPITITNGSTVYLGDDDVSAGLPIGFRFNFWGNDYTDFHISSNGFITFNPSSQSGCCAGQNLPSPNAPNNLIAFAWEDLDPGNGGQPHINLIRYQTIGTAPDRILIVEFFNVDHYPSGDRVTTQIHLIESNHSIEIHTTSQSDSRGAHTMGIENANGTDAVTVTGRNSALWTATNEAVVFSPQINPPTSNYNYNWTSSNGFNATNTAQIQANPTNTTVYTCTADDGVCTTTRSVQIGCNLLPVQCEDFSAKQQGKNIHLQWATLGEEDNLGFIIERSTDGILFDEIGWVEGSGNSSITQNYSYTDPNVINGVDYYYRLKQVDISNTAEYICNVIHQRLAGDLVQDVVISPNPTQGNAFLSIRATEAAEVELQILDVLGRTIKNIGTTAILQGHNQLEIPLAEFSAGIYYVKLSHKNQQFTQLKKIIKQ